MKRPGVQEALRAIESGEATALVVAKLDRLSRSMIDFTRIMAEAQKQGWALVALDCAVDTTTPAGEAMAHMLATFAQFERRLISHRTREALAIKKAEGVQLGRPRSMPEELRERIRRMHAAGESLAAIVRTLTTERVATAQGGVRWYPSTVRAVLQSETR